MNGTDCDIQKRTECTYVYERIRPPFSRDARAGGWKICLGLTLCISQYPSLLSESLFSNRWPSSLNYIIEEIGRISARAVLYQKGRLDGDVVIVVIIVRRRRMGLTLCCSQYPSLFSESLFSRA